MNTVSPSSEDVRRMRGKLHALYDEEKLLNSLINDMRNELVSLATEEDYYTYAYITHNDVLAID